MKSYQLVIDYPKESSSYEVFKNSADLMLALDRLNSALSASITEEIETQVVIENLEAGSIRLWLADKLKRVPDEKIKAYVNNYKEAIGDFLIASKRKIIHKLEHDPESINEEVPQIVRKEAHRAGLDAFGYKIHKTRILEAVGELSRSAQSFDYKPVIEIEGKKMVILDNYRFDPEELDTVERQVHTIRDLFLIKKPDLLGKSKWTLIYDRAIDVTIADEAFIQRVKNREVTIGHGDRLDADLLIETFLDMEDMEVIETRYTVTRVYGVVPPQTQDNPPLLA